MRSWITLLPIVLACSTTSTFPPDSGPNLPDTSIPPDDDSSIFQPDGGVESGPKPIVSHLTGKVFAPEGTIPISGALVYLTSVKPSAIPSKVYCDKCVTITDDMPYALTNSDGSFDVGATSIGSQYIVVQKGGFRRVRTINVAAGAMTVPAATTTLPGTLDIPKGDEMPRMAVLEGTYDSIEESLKRLGIVEQPGVFDILPDWDLLLTYTDLEKYHTVFMPCTDDVDSSLYATVQKNLQDFVAAGGRAYVTDWSYDYVVQPWPPYITLVDQTSDLCSACGGEYDAPATVQDKGLKDWLAVQKITTFDLLANWTKIDQVHTVDTTDKDKKPVKVTPKVWVTGDVDSMQRPTTISFERACGRVLFSTYHSESGNTTLTPQELALLYILLEVSVCVDSTTGVIVPPK